MSKNKQAILIMVHNNLWTIEKILKLLDYEYFDIFIHIDKKSNLEIEDLEKIKLNKSNIFIYKNIDVRWADLSQVECELFLLNKSLKSGDYKYFHLISGADMPLKKAKEIFDFFDKYNKEFLHTHDISKETFDRINNYNIFTKYRRTSDIFLAINRLFVYLQKFLKINRHYDREYIKTGSNWFSITNNLAEYLVENTDNILEEYKYTISADEMFIQTMVHHSKFRRNVYGDIPNGFEDSMRYIDWNRGSPYTFRIDDLAELINSGCMFARKFDENVDNEIIEKLYEILKS